MFQKITNMKHKPSTKTSKTKQQQSVSATSHRPSRTSRSSATSRDERVAQQPSTSKIRGPFKSLASDIKSPRKKVARRKCYETDRVEKAIDEMKSGMSARQAALKWHVPRTTLQNRKKGGFVPVVRPGPATILTADEEQLFCDWLIELCRRGIPLQKDFLFDSIQRILLEDGRPNPFANNRPGKGWFKAFLKRHGDIAERYAEPVC